MCRRWFDSDPCSNFKCPNNLFSEDLRLNRNKIRMTDRAIEIRNCCCLIIHPWTAEEISEAWGLPREGIKRSEEDAFKKLKRKARINGKRPQSPITIARIAIR